MMNSLKNIGRRAGILYFIMDLFMIFGGMYVYSKIYIPGDVEATVNNILASEWLFRLGIVSNQIGWIFQLLLVHALYELFKSIDKSQARLMVILVVVFVSVAFLNTLNQFVPILLISGAGHLSAFNPTQLQTLAMVFLEMNEYGILINELLWGLWLIPLGILVTKSGFIPKVLGILLIIGCFGHLIIYFSTFLFQDYSAILTPIGEMVMVGELPIFLWLLIKGVKEK